MHHTRKSNVVENGAMESASRKLEFLARDYYEVEATTGRTPFHDLADAEEKNNKTIEEAKETEIKIEAISGMFSYLFAPVNGKMPNPLEVTQRVYILCYTVRPALIEGWSLERIAKCFDSTRQVYSKRLIRQNEKLLLRARTQKSDTSVSVYAENTTAWHKERKAKERAARRKAYLKAYRAEHRARLNLMHKEYFLKHKQRILRQQKERRALLKQKQ